MKKIDTTKWQAFVIGDLFEKLDLRFLPDRKFSKANDISLVKCEEFNLPLVNAKHGNNGIMYYGRECDWSSAEMSLDIVADGAASTGDVYAQPQKTGVLYNAYLIKPLTTISENSLIFLATVTQKCIKDHFGYENKCTWEKVALEKIVLPSTDEEEPDWDYMDKYMSEVIYKAKASLEQLNQISCEKRVVNIKSWGTFAIGTLFDIKKGSRLTKAQMKEGNIRYIGSSALNNGQTASIGNQDCIHPANLLTVCYNGSVGETFYQDEKFWASDDVNVLYPKFKMNRNIALFIAPLIKKVSEKYSYVNKWKLEDMRADEITLPITDDGEPDLHYMDSYIKNLIQESENALNTLQKII